MHTNDGVARNFNNDQIKKMLDIMNNVVDSRYNVNSKPRVPQACLLTLFQTLENILEWEEDFNK
jgi:hypothetical protein